MMKRIHYISGVIITIFISFHLFNHSYSLFGVEEHIRLMDKFRWVYRNVFAETLLLIAVFIQIFSGIRLFLRRRKNTTGFFEKLQVWSGLYLAVFFVFHLGAVFTGRFFLDLDTNIYFGVAGLNTFPINLFFIPYYGLAILSFFGHISAINYVKMKNNVLGLTPRKQSVLILVLGVVVTLVLFYGLTNGYRGIEIPKEYHILIGK
ncbi:succinate dehydrogenase/fumarate reductase cytochrome b subunit [Aquimarina sp. EL_43]|uniref:hypothetical protein n=1 Tax=unclassified Aquimarina TaxID=2627091 RepID=UPI0018CA9471|nr:MULTISPECIES: hypothetical protein [unclassified Aquimarina]MBG6133747.1 succinate dehydrogenase/fumarate reductase cytochrome b subunit [Aquimarina sp. EL_35]MBG6153914.1 succinate dehydrogenase/fumarate reductase cytochrome b subunit [Aquimarina sp. EL_32]MBG6172138.1 succinate dehydrogenase/fumarate reductase cytochrome b subunit [Aquimarina sp. EL_43]